MTAQQLKNSILQMAVQGKLVPQDPNDEPASVLLERIRTEKERLIKEKKIKKEKNSSVIFRGSDNLPYADLPFDVPEGWVWVRLNDVAANIHYGYTASAQPTGNAKLLRITDIQNNVVCWRDVPFCEPMESEYATYGLSNRDIMIARTGGTIGKSYIVRNLEGRAVFASYLIRVIPLESIYEEYLKVFLETPFYWEQLKSYSMGTGQPNVNGQSLKKLVLPLPPLAEQRRIVARIEELLPHVADYAAAEQKLTVLNAAFPGDLKKSILQAAVMGKLVPQDPDDEPASALLERIRAEKEALIKAGKIKRDKRESVIFRRDNSHY
uniref:restriction endonuclease subunit S n=1 Tax=Lacrimispora amygdalina TaxID=253257 RepID=UPI001FA8A13B